MARIDEITIQEIAIAEAMHPVHIARVLRKKGAPKCTRKIGPTKMFKSRDVLAFFNKRRRTGIGRK